MRYLLFSILAILIYIPQSFAQNKEYAQQMINTLASEEFSGRGYTDKGINKAANFIEEQYEMLGLQSFDKGYAQDFSFPINTIQKTNTFTIDGQSFKPGSEYLISAFSKSFKGTYEIVYIPDNIYDDKKARAEFYKKDFTDKFVVFSKNAPLVRRTNELSARGIIFLNDNLTWSVSSAQIPQDYVVIDMLEEDFPKGAKSITINFKSKFYPKYKTQNTIGYIQGSEYPDSFIVISAHYDHIGKMGKETYFLGANDNASGVAMMLDLAKHYSKPENKPKCSIAFMAFSGEEVGLLGSRYYVNHPLFSLEKIGFLINLDMVGTGSDGIAVVNGAIFEDHFNKMEKINEEANYISRLKKRGEACNSDHCEFYKKGVPSFFIYTQGKEYTDYHNVSDIPSAIPLTAYEGVFKLMRDFINQY